MIYRKRGYLKILIIAVVCVAFLAAAITAMADYGRGNDKNSKYNSHDKYGYNKKYDGHRKHHNYHSPADRVSVAGSGMAAMAPGDDVVLLSEMIKTSKMADLIIQFSAECTIMAQQFYMSSTKWNDFNDMGAMIKVWVEVDGVPVPVASDEVADEGNGVEVGQVVFANQVHNYSKFLEVADKEYTIKIPNMTNPKLTIEGLPLEINESVIDMTTRANAFNWIALDVGYGKHTVEVKADLTTFGDSQSFDTNAVWGIVGKRTLVIEPVHLLPNEGVDPYAP
jgi:hypothetical protein